MSLQLSFYQARNGSVYLQNGVRVARLTIEQVERMGGPSAMELDDFDRGDFDRAYRLEENKNKMSINAEQIKEFDLKDGQDILTWFDEQCSTDSVSIPWLWQNCPNDEWLLDIAARLGPEYFQKELERAIKYLSDTMIKLGCGVGNDGLADVVIDAEKASAHHRKMLEAAQAAIYNYRIFKLTPKRYWRGDTIVEDGEDMSMAKESMRHGIRWVSLLNETLEAGALRRVVLALGRELGVPIARSTTE